MTFKRAISILTITFTLVCAGHFTMGAGMGGQGMSRSMEQAIRLYNRGRDNAAMDRFMDILVRGTPSEKALANDYLNRITNRMHAGEIILKDSSEGLAPAPKAPVVIPVQKESRSSARVTRRPGLPDEDEGKDALIKKRIETQLASMRKAILSKLNGQKGVKIYMDGSITRAIEFDSKALFSKQTNFSSGAPALLSNLSGLMFATGKARFLILPSGAVNADVKILDMRRAIAVNSYLTRRGISPARVEVNLMGTNVRLPPKLRIVRDLAVVFIYGEEPRLETLLGTGKKPQISLGIYPTSISTYKNEGAIIEFSIMEPHDGMPTWNFQIQRIDDDGTTQVIQEASGSEAIYHQIYWNGRKGFFGDSFPSGKYSCLLTASDIRGTKNVLQRLVVLQPMPGRKIKSGKARRRNAVSALPLSAGSLQGMSFKKFGTPIVLSSFRKSTKQAAKASLTARRLRSGADLGGFQKQPEINSQSDAAAGGGEITEFSGQVSYKIIFRDQTTVLTSDGDKKIRQVADTMNYWPLAKLTLVGYAYSKEPKAESVALERANIVANVLTDNYGVSRGRMQIRSKVTNVRQSMVEIKMASRK